MHNKEFIPYAQQSIDASDKEAVAKACESPFITRGPLVEQFEEAVANYCGAKYAVAFSSGTAALHGSAFAVDTKPFDRLYVPGITFVASAAATGHGAALNIVDIDPNNGNIELEQLSQAMQKKYSRGKSILTPVHFGGTPIDMKLLQETIIDPQAVVIEDAAHAIGSRYPNGKKSRLFYL